MMILFEEKQRFGKQFCEILPMALAMGGAGLGLGALGSFFGAKAEKQKLALQRQAMQQAASDASNAKAYNAVEGARAGDEIRRLTSDAQRYAQQQTGAAKNILSPYNAFGLEQMGALREHLAQTPETYLDPGYQFRLKTGSDAIQNSAAASGMLGSGDTLRALTNYGQDMGSQEYSNAFNRYVQKAGLLQGDVRAGQEAAGGIGSAGLQGAGTSGQFGLQGAGLRANLFGNQLSGMNNLTLGGSQIQQGYANNMDPGAGNRVWGNFLGGVGGMALGGAGTMAGGNQQMTRPAWDPVMGR